MSVGVNIKKRRFELRMTQQELADAMGYKTRSTIAKIESEENDVSQKKLERFARVLDTTVEELISGYMSTALTGTEPANTPKKKVNTIAIILAGGKTGTNRQNVPAQFMSVRGKPLIVYSLEIYQAHPSVDAIYVVCLKGWENIVQSYADQYGITKLKGFIPAGRSGVGSLKNAIDHLQPLCRDEDLIIIQEATRPRVTTDTVSHLLQICTEKNSATMGHPMTDYVQFDISGGKSRYLDRNSIIAMQSPEAHKFHLMRKVFALAAAQNHTLTESCCTMLLHNMGFSINFVPSNINNIKITTEEDFSGP